MPRAGVQNEKLERETGIEPATNSLEESKWFEDTEHMRYPSGSGGNRCSFAFLTAKVSLPWMIQYSALSNIASGGLLPEPALHRVTIDQDALARVTQVALAAEAIHVMRDDLAGSAHVL